MWGRAPPPVQGCVGTAVPGCPSRAHLRNAEKGGFVSGYRFSDTASFTKSTPTSIPARPAAPERQSSSTLPPSPGTITITATVTGVATPAVFTEAAQLPQGRCLCAQSKSADRFAPPLKITNDQISPYQLTSPSFRGKLPSEPAFRRITAGCRNKICSRNLCRGPSFALTSRILT